MSSSSIAKGLYVKYKKSSSKKLELLSLKQQNPNVIASFFSKLTEDEIKRFAFDNFYIQDVSRFFSDKDYKISNIFNEVVWNVETLKPFSSLINKFESLEKRFYQEIFCNNFSEATNTLEMIEAAFGLSLWGIENKFLLLERSEGVGANKEYYNNLMSQSELRRLTGTVIGLLSEKCERNVALSRFSKNLETLIEGQHETYKSFLRFRLLPFNLLGGGDEFKSVFGWEYANSFLDRYVAVRKLSFCILKSCPDGVLRKNYLNQFSQVVPILVQSDDFFEKNIPGFKAQWEPIIKCYSQNNYEATIEMLLKFIDPFTVDLLKYELLAKCCLKLGTNSSVEKIKNSLISTPVIHDYFVSLLNYFGATDKTGASLAALEKLTLEISAPRLQSQISSMLVDEVFASLQAKQENLKLLRCSVPEQHPKILSLAKRLSANVNHSPAANELCFDRALELFTAKEFKLAAKLSGEGLASADAFEKLRFYKLRIKASLLSESLLEIFKSFVEAFIYNPLIISEDCWDQAKKLAVGLSFIESRKLFVYIETPIFYEILKRRFPDFDSHNARMNLDFYLRSHNVRDLEAFVSGLEHNPVSVFLLKEVFSYENLVASGRWEDHKQVAGFRVFICQKLLNFNAGNDTQIENELKRCSELIILSEAISKIHKGKVFVNSDAVIKACVRECSDLFERAQEMQTRNVSQVIHLSISSENSYKGIVSPGEIRRKFSIQNSLVGDILKKVYQEFVEDKKHGLKSFLSQNIRHGHMEETLRFSFEACFILARKDASGAYLVDESKLDALNFHNQDDKDKVIRRIQEFSSSFDKILQVASTEWISIKTSSNLGKFDFDAYELGAIGLSMEISSFDNCESFVANVINHLWGFVRSSLGDIKNCLRTTFVNDVKKEIANFVRDIRNACHDDGALEKFIGNIDISLEEFVKQVEVVCTWFDIPESKDFQDMPDSLVWECCKKTIADRYPYYNFNIRHGNFLGRSIKGDKVRGLIDIFFLLLTNVVKHGARQNNEVLLDVDFENKGDDLYFRLVNSIPKTTSEAQVLAAVAEINERVGVKGIERSTQEGGSGFDKVIKVLTYDMQIKEWDVSSKYLKDTHSFAVEVRISSRGVLA